MVLPIALAAAMLAQAVPGPRAVEAVSFHHFHFRVGDPAAAMNHGARTLSGTRVLVRGMGVGVRVGTAHALFDRLDASEPPASGLSPAAAYAAASAWLRAHGVDVTQEGSNAAAKDALGELFRDERLDHIAFTAGDLGAVLAALSARGATPVRQTSDGALFQPAGAAPVEIVRDVDAPDAYWCPMHPDVRSSEPGACPICTMALVPIPPPRLGEYRMDLATTAGRDGGIARLRITLREPDSDRRVASLATVHERLLHLFIIDRSLQFFRHVHPEPAGDGEFELRDPIPPGEYVVLADFLPLAGVSQMVHRVLVTPGYRGPLFPEPPDLSRDTARVRTVDGMRVELEATNLKAGREANLRFTLSDGPTMEPVRDLEPLLGAPGHLLIVTPDLTEADHVHPQEPITRGPAVTFQPLLPSGGFYKVWLQVQRRGVVVTVPFVISAEDR